MHHGMHVFHDALLLLLLLLQLIFFICYFLSLTRMLCALCGSSCRMRRRRMRVCLGRNWRRKHAGEGASERGMGWDET
jgi:hypothetical protein